MRTRTRIYLRALPPEGPGRLGSWDDGPGAPYIEVSHDGELSDDQVAAWRSLGNLAAEHLDGLELEAPGLRAAFTAEPK